MNETAKLQSGHNYKVPENVDSLTIDLSQEADPAFGVEWSEETKLLTIRFRRGASNAGGQSD